MIAGDLPRDGKKEFLYWASRTAIKFSIKEICGQFSQPITFSK